ncbi:MAG: helix-turn-helix transcriptional regulator [Clostridia bacterium]|nr:helix-turn-helix transcriptional regulator [Clostridia bacterium]
MEHIGQRIKDLRKKADMTQDRLAEYIGVSPQAVSKWEVGSASLDLSLIAPLCRVLGCSSDELLGIGREENEREAQLLRETDLSENVRLECRAHYEKCLRAVEEFPRNMTLQLRLAAAESRLARECRPPEKGGALRRRRTPLPFHPR